MSQPSCPRCSGFLSPEYVVDLYDGLFAWLSRCVSCGNLFDPVLLANRLKQHHPMDVRREPRIVNPLAVS